jgi:hypothetical protein
MAYAIADGQQVQFDDSTALRLGMESGVFRIAAA